MERDDHTLSYIRFLMMEKLTAIVLEHVILRERKSTEPLLAVHPTFLKEAFLENKLSYQRQYGLYFRNATCQSDDYFTMITL